MPLLLPPDSPLTFSSYDGQGEQPAEWASLQGSVCTAARPHTSWRCLSKAEKRTGNTLSGTCPDTSLLGEHLSHSKDSREESRCFPFWHLLSFPFLFIPHRRECRVDTAWPTLLFRTFSSYRHYKMFIWGARAWVPHFSIAVLYFKHTPQIQIRAKRMLLLVMKHLASWIEEPALIMPPVTVFKNQNCVCPLLEDFSFWDHISILFFKKELVGKLATCIGSWSHF